MGIDKFKYTKSSGSLKPFNGSSIFRGLESDARDHCLASGRIITEYQDLHGRFTHDALLNAKKSLLRVF